MAAAGEVTERDAGRSVPLREHPGWAERFPWLVQGTTARGEEEGPFDLGLAGTQPVGEALGRWRALLRATGMTGAVHARQVHGAELALHAGPPAPGILLMDGVDGHVTDRPGLLLTVGVADCVPVSIVDPERRAVALLHAGWRGTAEGIVEAGIARLARETPAERLWLHCGPAICGMCYEVGPEVHAAVRPDAPAPGAPAPIDLRAAIVERARAAGLAGAHVTRSSLCTRCDADAFFSHRGGSRARQVGVLGIRPG